MTINPGVYATITPSKKADAGQLALVLRAIRGGVTYVNVHSTEFPGGEIRGQLRFTPD